MLLIRCDANPDIGAGHFFRELALAEAAIDRGLPVAIAMHRPSETFAKLADSSGVGLLVLEEEPGSLEDAAKVRKLAEERGATAVVIDGYGFKTAFYDVLASGEFTLSAVDDLAHQHFPVDILINVNPHATDLSYDVPSDTQLLLGVDYALLRRQFRQTRALLEEAGPIEAPEDVSKMLVTMGGSDATNETNKVIRALCSTDYIGRVDVVVGPANPHLDQLKAAAARSEANFCFHRNVREMAKLMQGQHMAICAAGGTSWELACVGVPMLQMVVADNQRGIAHWLAAQDVTEMLGWRENVDRARLMRKVERLRNSSAQRKQMATRGMRMVDGRGAYRVLDEIGATSNSHERI